MYVEIRENILLKCKNFLVVTERIFFFEKKNEVEHNAVDKELISLL